MKTKRRYYAMTDIKVLQFLLYSRVTAMALHWTFQSMLSMDFTELSFKIITDILLTLIFSLLLVNWLPLVFAILISFFIAHTLNFLFNGQIIAVLKHFGDITHELSEFEQYINAIKTRLQKEPSIRWAALYGSITRGELKTTSDLDIRMIRYPGFINGVRACWFTLLERTRAFLQRYPIDILVLDSPRLLKRLRPDESPLVIFDASVNTNHGSEIIQNVSSKDPKRSALSSGMMKSLILKLEKLRLNRFQRLLLFGSVTLWFLSIVLSVQRNYQDSWILEGIFWPFVGFIVIFLVVLWMEDDNRWVAIVCAWAVIVILLVPSLKYKQVYGEAIDAVAHYRIIDDLKTFGRISPNVYQVIAGMHSWLASMGITSGLSTSDIIKLGFPLLGGILPLLFYWICRRTQMPSGLPKYVISLSCLATYPYHTLTGTGFTLIPLLCFMSIMLVREYFCTTISENIIYTLLALITLVQLTIWHSTTPLLLLMILVGVSFTPVLVWLVTDRNKKVSINIRFLDMSLLAAVLILGYHTVETDKIFKVVFSRLYQLFVAENNSTAIVPASLFKLTLIEALKVYLVVYGREALLFILMALGLFVIWRHRNRLDRLLYSYAYWSLIIIIFLIAIPMSLLGLDFRRLTWIPLTISPFFGGYFLWQWKQNWARNRNIYQWLMGPGGFLLTLLVIGIFVIEFYIYQPLIPKSKSLTPNTPDEYSVWLHQVNTAYQQRMITFAETFSGPEMRFEIDIFGNRQYMRYYGGVNNRGLYLPLAPMMGWDEPENTPKKRLFLLHWPGRAGGFAEQVTYRSVKNLTTLRNTKGWGLIYDNGESYILQIFGFIP